MKRESPKPANMVIAVGIISAVVILGVIFVVDHVIPALTYEPAAGQDDLIPFTASQKFDANDIDATIDTLLLECAFEPETLASTMSAFPTTLRTVGIEAVEPDALYDLLIGEDGSDIQITLLRTLRFLTDSTGVYGQYTYWSRGEHQMLFLKLRDETADRTPENTTILWGRKNLLIDDRILAITATYDNGVTEIGYFCLADGFARILPNDGDVRR